MRPISSAAEYNERKLSSLKKSCRQPMKACQITSNTEPCAISMYCAKSVCDMRDVPSAVFEDIETAARRILVRKTEPLVSREIPHVIMNQIGEIYRLLPDV